MGIPKICDFGLARLTAASRHQTTTGSLRGSIRWLSPEFLNEGRLHNKHTKEADVWAFGMTTYVSRLHFIFDDALNTGLLSKQELLTQRRPYHDKSHIFDIIRTIANGMKPEFLEVNKSSSTSSKTLRDVCHICWLISPEERWPMSRIVRFLSDSLQGPKTTSCRTPSASSSTITVESLKI